MDNKSAEKKILRLEKDALDRWGKGDPSGYLEISAPEVTYFDPFIEQRLNGLDALSSYYESLRGKVHIDNYEFIDPRVTVHGDVAILTFNLLCHSGATQFCWNCSEAFKNFRGNWKIIQTHWSLTQAQG